MSTFTFPLQEESVNVSIDTTLEQYSPAVPSFQDTADQTFTQSVIFGSLTNSFDKIIFRADSNTNTITTIEIQDGFDIKLGFLTNTGPTDMTVIAGSPDYTDETESFTTIASVLIRIVLVELLKVTVAHSKHYVDIIDGYTSNINTINTTITNALTTLFGDANTDFNSNKDTEIEINDIANTFSNEVARNFLNAMIYFIDKYNTARASNDENTIYSETDINTTGGATLKEILTEMLNNNYTLVVPIMLNISGIKLETVTSTSTKCKINYTLDIE